MEKPLKILYVSIKKKEEKKEEHKEEPKKEEEKKVEIKKEEPKEEPKKEEEKKEESKEEEKKEEPKVEEEKKEEKKEPKKPREPEPKIPTDFTELINEINDMKKAGNEKYKTVNNTLETNSLGRIKNEDKNKGKYGKHDKYESDNIIKKCKNCKTTT